MRRVINLNPQHATAINYLAYTWAEMGTNLQEALELARKAVALKPESGYITDTVGWVYYRMGEYGSAVKYLERAATLVVDDPIISEHLGDAYVKSGQLQKGLGAYLKAQRLGTGGRIPFDQKNQGSP